MDNEKILLNLSIAEKGNWNSIYAKIVKKAEIEECKDFKGQYTTILNRVIYPDVLRNNCPQPPFVLYYEGDINLLTNSNLTKIAIGCTRTADSERKAVADKLIGESSNNIYILHGASELDEYLIKTYPTNKYIVVLGKPLSTLSKTLKKIILNNGGLIVSETPENALTDLTSSQIMGAYRIISALADKVLIISVMHHSAVNCLIAYGLSMGKDIYVAPISPTQTAYSNNQYLNEGAIAVWNKECLDY